MFTFKFNAVVWMLGKNTILKAIHNKTSGRPWTMQVWMLGKNTILKAIHNKSAGEDAGEYGVNAG